MIIHLRSENSMNICYISKTAIPSTRAESIYVMQMCQAYASLGHKVTLLVPNHPISVDLGNADVFSFYGVRHPFDIRKIPLPRWCPDMMTFGTFLPLAALSTQPDLVHSRSVAPAWGTTNLFRLPTIFEIHNAPSENHRQVKLFKEVVTNQNLLALVVLTNALANHVKQLLPENTRLLVAPDGIDTALLCRQKSPKEARSEIGMAQEQRRIVVYTGHLYPGRGIELIIELAQHMPDHLFLIVGGRDSDITHYRQQTSHLNNFHLAGFKSPAQVFTYLQAADALLMPYANKVTLASGGDTSSFCSPMKMFEYMAAGRPILASTLPVLQEVLKDGINAFLLPYDQPEKWIESLRRLQQDSTLAEDLGRQAHTDVRDYTWEIRAKRLLENCGF